MRNALIVLLAGASVACGSSGVTTIDDAGADATVSGRDGGTSPPFDAAGFADAGGGTGPQDAGPETGPRADDAGRAADAAVTCGTGPACTGGQVCCGGVNDAGPTFTCQASCADGGFTFACDGPEDCTPAGAHCCATLQLGAGTFPFCPPSAGGARCRQVCDQQIPFSCQATGQVRLCKKKADCTAPDNDGYTECCTFSQGGASATFCATTQMSGFAQGCTQ